MRILVAVLMALTLVSFAAGSNACPTESVTLYSNQRVRLKLVSEGSAPRSIKVALYSKGTLLRALVTDDSGEVNFEVLPEGNYQLAIRKWGKLDLRVRPEKGLNGPLITWFRPKLDLRSVGGENAPRPCLIIQVAN